MISLIREAIAAGARLSAASRVAGLTERTVQRWLRQSAGGQDARKGPTTRAQHALTQAEKMMALAHANRPEYRNLSPEAIVAKLADEDIYVCSERTLRRVQEEHNQATHRGRAKPASPIHKPRAYAAAEPLKVLSWDITYMRNSLVRGGFFFLYMYIDVWSRRILGWAIHEEQSSELAADLLRDVCAEHDIQADSAVLHQDNGAPMKGATFLATLDALGVTKSFSRPGVSDDNAFIESLFRHLKYAPGYPAKGFFSVDEAQAWVERFVAWYNHEHLHRAIGYVTPDDRHQGRDLPILEARRQLYELARSCHPRRWTGATRRWSRPDIVTLNPDRMIEVSGKSEMKAA